MSKFTHLECVIQIHRKHVILKLKKDRIKKLIPLQSYDKRKTVSKFEKCTITRCINLINTCKKTHDGFILNVKKSCHDINLKVFFHTKMNYALPFFSSSVNSENYHVTRKLS